MNTYRFYDLNDTAKYLDIKAESLPEAVDIFMERTKEDVIEYISQWKFVTPTSKYFVSMNPRRFV